MARKKKQSKSLQAKISQQRRKRGSLEELPVFIDQACEFSDDPKCLSNALWVFRAIKQELIGGGGPVGNLWQDLRDDLAGIIEGEKQCEGRPRMEGDWLLLFLAYVMSKQPEMMEFWQNEIFDGFWAEAGFDIAKKPNYNTLHLRFSELENPRIVRRIAAAADALVSNAKRNDPDIGRVIHLDASGFHSRAVLHHCCPDPEECKKAGGNWHLEPATAKRVKMERWAEVEKPGELGLRHSDSPKKKDGEVELRPDARPGEFKKIIKIKGHYYGLHDIDAGVRSYKDPDGTTREFWVGGYDIIAVDGKYGAKLQGVIAPADRQECNLYFPLMRRLQNTLGEWPEAVTGDAGQSFKKIFRFNTRRGIASILPWRPQVGTHEREDMRFEEIDEHGVCRCEHCGAACKQVGFELRDSGPTFLVRCELGLTDECKGKRQTKHPEDLPHGWRLLIPVSRLTERYYALRNAHSNMEHVFHHQRQRYRTIGNDQTGKLKRFGSGAHELRSEVARLLEWFRLSVRFGWLGSERRIKHIRETIRRGWRALRQVEGARIRRGLHLPYGKQAHRLGWALTPDVPPPIEPKPKT